jgi:hypothetical protein
VKLGSGRAKLITIPAARSSRVLSGSAKRLSFPRTQLAARQGSKSALLWQSAVEMDEARRVAANIAKLPELLQGAKLAI